jgi:hypothetical protein
MSKTNSLPTQTDWKDSEKNIFRFLFLYFLLQSLPLSLDFFSTMFGINWLHLSYQDLFNLTRFSPKFIPGDDSFVNWIIVVVLALIGSLVWKSRKDDNYNYDNLYYWLRVIVRYRLAIGIIGYGFIKLFPLQAPLPSISNLNTNYGDFDDWKIFSLSLGIVPSYESFLGAIELLAGVLLLFRKTASIGAVIILVFTGNVFISNLAYEGGEYVYSFYLIALALFVLAFDALRIHRLVSLEKPADPATFKPVYAGNVKIIRIVAKTLVIFLFVFLYGFKTYSGYRKDQYQFPKTAGLAHSSGLYNVREFRINGKELPYSLTDPVRWKDVVFEKWATLSIRSNRPVIIQTANYEQIHQRDEDRDYELAGSGGRHYYSYKADTVKHILYLANKNKNYQQDKFQLSYNRLNDSTITLSGINSTKDSVYVVLDKLPKKHLLFNTGRRGRVKL